MRHLIYIFVLLLILLPAVAPAQNICCCCKKRELGQAAFDKGQYKTAIQKWQEGQRCSDAVKCPDLSDLVEKANKKLTGNNASKTTGEKIDSQADDEAWNRVKDSQDSKLIQTYLDKYPHGRHATAAQKLINAAQTTEKKTVGTENPQLGKKTDTATTNSQADDEAWNRVKNSQDSKLIQTYLDKYPQGRHANTAQALIISVLQTEKERLETERRQLSKKMDIASAIRVKNITVKAADVRDSGKEKSKSRTRKVDKLNICFMTEPNEIVPAGEETFYLVVIDPTGAPLAIESLGSGITQDKRNEQEFRYTTTATCDYGNGETQVCSAWQPGQNFVKGKYEVKIYNKGYLVGSGSFNLK